MEITANSVREWTTFRIRRDDGTYGHIPAALGWHRTDPYSVHVRMRNREPWAWYRNLLIRGLIYPVGDGDVRVQPIWDTIAITLNTHDGHAVLLADRNQMATFLEATCDIVHLGAEVYDLDIDLAFLLADGEAA